MIADQEEAERDKRIQQELNKMGIFRCEKCGSTNVHAKKYNGNPAFMLKKCRCNMCLKTWIVDMGVPS